MEKINLEGDHVPWPDGGLERTGSVLEPMKLTHLVKYVGSAKPTESTSLMRSMLSDFKFKFEAPIFYSLGPKRINFTYIKVIPNGRI
jgi:hypothetical protein